MNRQHDPDDASALDAAAPDEPRRPKPEAEWRPLEEGERADVNDTECLTPDGKWVKAAGAHGYTLAECRDEFAEFDPIKLRTRRPKPEPDGPSYIDKRQTCSNCGLPHTGDHACSEAGAGTGGGDEYDATLADCERLRQEWNKWTDEERAELGRGAEKLFAQTAREWVKELLYTADGRNLVLDADDAYTLADRCDAAERKRDDYEAGWRTYKAKCAELQAELDKVRDREKAIIQFCETEMGWMYFRAEFAIGPNPTKTEENASKMRQFLKQNGGLP
jgi:hypothetical protein